MKSITKISAVIISLILLLTSLPVVSAYEEFVQEVKFYYSVSDGKAIVTGIDNVIVGTVSLPDNLDGYPVIAIGDNAFKNCEDIAEFTIPYGVVSIGNSAFSGCRNLSKVILPESIESIGKKAFFECTALGGIVLPENLTVLPEQCFANCYSIETVRLSQRITTIANGAFSSCYNLAEIFIPKTVTSIGDGAFQDNYCLSICYCATEDDWNLIRIGNNNTSLETTEISYHKYESSYTKPTCSQLGRTVYTCAVCSHSYFETDTSSGFSSHDYEEEYTIDKEATDFETGIKSRHCKNCEAFEDVTVIPRTSSAYGEYNENIKWAIKKNGTLVILGSGSIGDYKLPLFTPWNEYSAIIFSLEISKDITGLGNNSFSSLEKLNVAEIHNPNTEFGTYVFPDSVNIKIKCFKNSTAEQYAIENNYSIAFFSAPEAPIIESIVKNTATLKKIDGYEYSVDGETWQENNVFAIPQNEIITFYQRIRETEVSIASPPSDAVKGISVSAPEVVFVGKNEIHIKPYKEFEYGIENVLWQAENSFVKWIIPNETYTVYQRYKGADDVFAAYDTAGTTVTVNGDNIPQELTAEYLIWLKKLVFEETTSNNRAADFNGDFYIDILDLVALKTELLWN